MLAPNMRKLRPFIISPLLLAFLATPRTSTLAAATPEDTVQIFFAGDIMLDTLPGEEIAQGRDPFLDFSDIFAKADLSIGNLECVVATVGEKVEKPYNFRAAPAVLNLLKKHFGAVTLANNHTGDFGHEAFLEQIGLLRSHKIPYFGGGKDISEARTPYLFECHGIRIALLGYNDFKPRQFEAGPDWPGVAWAVDEQIVADLQAARTRHHADIVIPFMHWGWEYEEANERQKSLARLMIENGADTVVGAHPHVTQAPEYYKGRLIVYSLGNFVFDGFTTPDTLTGWVLRLKFSKTGLLEWDTVVATLDERGIPHVNSSDASPYGSAPVEAIGKRKFTR